MNSTVNYFGKNVGSSNSLMTSNLQYLCSYIVKLLNEMVLYKHNKYTSVPQLRLIQLTIGLEKVEILAW